MISPYWWIFKVCSFLPFIPKLGLCLVSKPNVRPKQACMVNACFTVILHTLPLEWVTILALARVLESILLYFEFGIQKLASVSE